MGKSLPAPWASAPDREMEHTCLTAVLQQGDNLGKAIAQGLAPREDPTNCSAIE